MSLLIVLGALAFLMLVAYRGYSVILFAPVAAMGAVLLTDPSLVPPMFSIVVVCAILTYGGVSLFVVVFAVYPFAAEMFRQSNIPKRLIPCTIALGAFTFTMDSLPCSPQIQNIIPTTFFKTTT